MRNTLIASVMACVIIAGTVIYAKKYSVVESKGTPTPVVQEEQIQHEPFMGTQWVWLHTELPNGSLVSTPAREQYVVIFEASGILNSTTDCNTFTGTYETNEEVLSISPLASTKKACEDTLESIYAKDLMLATSYTIMGSRLTVHLNRDVGTMIFEKK